MNRHLKIAFFIAPFLALGAYVLTGFYVSPKEIKNQQNKLRLLGDCQPQENACLFKLGQLELKLISNQKQQQHQLAIITNEATNELSVALGDEYQFKQFPMMKSDDLKYWQIKLNKSDNILNYSKLRIALTYKDENYYADSEVIFNGN